MRNKEKQHLPPHRRRDKQLKVWISQEELDLLRLKLAEFGAVNQSAYIRKMIIDGYVFKLELPELKEILRLMGPTASNVNQIARKLNSDGSVYQEDIQDVQNRLDQVYEQLRTLLFKLSKLD